MITRLTLSTIKQTLPKYRSMLAGNTAYDPGAFVSIATATSTGSSATLTFSSIPSTYQHLQIRGIARNATQNDLFYLRFNSDSGTNYSYHRLTGNGSSASASGSATQDALYQFGRSPSAANVFGPAIYDILDYANTSKYKTIRGFQGYEDNSGGSINLVSGLWQSSSVITRIDITMQSSLTFASGTTFALYGIKGA